MSRRTLFVSMLLVAAFAIAQTARAADCLAGPGNLISYAELATLSPLPTQPGEVRDTVARDFHEYAVIFHDVAEIKPRSSTNEPEQPECDTLELRNAFTARLEEEFARDGFAGFLHGGSASFAFATGAILGSRGELTPRLHFLLSNIKYEQPYQPDLPPDHPDSIISRFVACGHDKDGLWKNGNDCLDDTTVAAEGTAWRTAFLKLSKVPTWEDERRKTLGYINDSLLDTNKAICIYDQIQANFDGSQRGPCNVQDISKLRQSLDAVLPNGQPDERGAAIIPLNHIMENANYGIGLVSTLANAYLALEIIDAKVTPSDYRSWENAKTVMEALFRQGQRAVRGVEDKLSVPGLGRCEIWSNLCYRARWLPEEGGTSATCPPANATAQTLIDSDFLPPGDQSTRNKSCSDFGQAKYRVSTYPVRFFYSEYGFPTGNKPGYQFTDFDVDLFRTGGHDGPFVEPFEFLGVGRYEIYYTLSYEWFVNKNKRPDFKEFDPPACETNAPRATVSGGGRAEPGGTVDIRVVFTGGGPYEIRWSDGRDDKNIITPVFTRKVTPSQTIVDYSITDVTGGGCTGTSSGFARVFPNACPLTPTLRLYDGLCTISDTPRMGIRGNGLVTLKPLILENGVQPDDDIVNEYEFTWTVNGEVKQVGRGVNFWAYQHLVTANAQVRVDVRLILGVERCLIGSLVYQIDLLGITPCDAPCPVACKRRAVRSAGGGDVPNPYSFTPGDTLAVLAPEEAPGYTYTWYQKTASATQTIGNAAGITLVLQEPSEYWVSTQTTGGAVIESDRLRTILDAGSSNDVTIEPLYQSIPAGQTASITATFLRGADETTQYEWRTGNTYDATAPVIGRGRKLYLRPADDDVYWCRIIHNGQTFDSDFATIVVPCSGVGGSIRATPSHVARGQRPRLSTLGFGKLLTYTWYRTLPNDPTPVVVGGPWGTIYPTVTDPVTYFSAEAVDACGVSGSFGTQAVYLCVPTIDVPPQGRLELPGTPVTLSVAATPAIDGQEIAVTWHHVSDAWASFPLGTGTSFTTTLPAGTNSDAFYAALTTDCSGTPNKIKSAPATIEYCSYPVIHSYTHTDYITTSGGWARLSVAATGTSPTGGDLTYQWYLGEAGNTNTPLTGKTQSFLDIAPNTTTSYWCRVKSRNLCATDTGTSVVKVCRTPTIVTGPQSNRIFPNHTKELSVVADKGTNTDPLVYQWQRETAPGQWTDIAGANAATYTTPVLTADTNYLVKVSAGICEIISDPATIFMCVLPESVSGSEYKIEKNGSATLSLPPMSPVVAKNVVWYRGEPGDISNPVRSGVNVSYTTPQLTATTKYWAEFEYEGCVSRTTAYTVTVCKPTITTPPANATIQSGSSTPLTIVTTNMPGQTIQWYRGALGDTTNRLDGETLATYNAAPTTTTTYWVRVTSCGYNADAAATVTVCTPPQPTLVTPSPRYIKSGQTTSLQTYAPGSNLTYQWYLGTSGVTSNPINGQTTDWLQVSPTTNTNYWCKITSYGTCVTNGPTITVDVCENPAINVQPLSQRVFSGTATTLTVNASSSRPLTYQWYRGDSGDTSAPIGSATSSPSVTVSPTTETKYWVRVINGVCSTDSATATISMCTFNPSYSGSEIKIGYNETATLSLPAMSPVVNKNVTWYRGAAGDISTPVRTGVNVSYTTPALTATTQYWAEFEYEGCISRTTTYTVNVCKPSITAQPANKTIQSGQSAPLSIGTTNIAGQTITWYAGAVGTTTTQVGTGASINVTPTATTNYWARVSSCGLNADSVAVTVTVCTPPNATIVTPSPRYIKSGHTTSLQTYSPSPSVTYQWYIGSSGVTSNPIAGQTTDWLQVAPTTNTNYWCKITSYGTCVTNGPTITVDVCQDPTITVQPLSQRAFSGTATTLSVTATSSRPLSYQWYRGATGDTSNPISGATSSSVNVSPTTETSYWVRAINGVCSTDSATATISMCTFNPTYSGSEIKIAYNTSATLSLPAMSPVVSKNVWWYRGAVGDKTTLVNSGVNASYTTPAMTANATYWAEFEYEGCYSRTTAYTVNVCKPTITTQPTNKSIASGQSTTLSLATTPIAGQTITWYIGAVGTTTTVAGTGASISVSPTTTTNYWARVSSCGFNADSVAVTVSVCTPPSITIVTPSPRYIKSGSSTSLQTYSPSPNVSYQWYIGTSGTTSSAVGTNSDWLQVSPSTTTNYWCKVTSNGTCVTNGPTITVNVCNLPTISAQPQSQRIFSGKSATLSVTASSPTHTLSYQWYIGGAGDTSSPISGATSSSVTVAPTSDTNYWVRVTTAGGACSVDSNGATVSMCTYPEVVPGASYNIASGQTQTLNLPTMSPVDNKNVVWYQGAVGIKTTPVRSGVNVSYTTPALTATTQYWAEFEHNGCYSRTEAYTVNVCKPTITAQPQSQVIFSGQTATLTVTATAAPLSYQWYRGSAGDTSQPVGTNSNTYTTPALSAAANYWVRITGCTTADSATATVTVCAAPTINSIDKDPWTSIGGTGSITVNATGTNLSYQWYEGLSGDTSLPITGATSANYTFVRQKSRYLWVRVTSSCNNASVNSVATMYSVDPKITQEPQDVPIVPTGTSATFSVTASGTHLSYQWYSQTTGLIAGATSATYTTPPLTASSSYYVKVTSGTNGYDYSNWVTAYVCQGPGVGGITATQINATTWKLTASVNSWEAPETRYFWYKGPVGNVAASVFQGESSNIFYAYNVTSSTSFWVRAMWLDESCYTDKGKTVP